MAGGKPTPGERRDDVILDVFSVSLAVKDLAVSVGPSMLPRAYDPPREERTMAGKDDELPERRKMAPARRFDGARPDAGAIGEIAGWLARLDEIDVHFTRIAGAEDFVRIDPPALEPLAEAIGMACEGLLDEGPPAGASRTLAWNLTLAARAYGDAIDVVLGTTDEKGEPFNPASDYQWSGVTGETDLALVIGVAREARDCAAREAGLPMR